ncbi:MAG: hypothetical protein JST92_27925, partial [Deltaproteobacteria bacterium]|nr:hypothetical protein [Deltaproteobacteria bacterium]
PPVDASQLPRRDTRPPPPVPNTADVVPRTLYDQLLAEKSELQQKLLAILSDRSSGHMVPRELFDQVQEEKRQLQEKMMQMVDELIKARSGPPSQQTQATGPRRVAPVRPLPGRKGSE